MGESLDRVDHDDRNVECDENRDEADAWPTAQVASLSIYNQTRKDDQEVAAEDDERIVDQFHFVGQWQDEGSHVPRVDHHERAFEDDGLDLKVAPLGPRNKNSRK